MGYRPAADASGPPRRRAGPRTQRRRASCHSCRIGAQAMASAARTRGRQRRGGRRDERGAADRRRADHGADPGEHQAPEKRRRHRDPGARHLAVPPRSGGGRFRLPAFGYDINDVSLVSHRRILGSLVLATKKVVRKLLAPILERQVAYNAASTRRDDPSEGLGRSAGQIGDTLRVKSPHSRQRRKPTISLQKAETRLHENEPRLQQTRLDPRQPSSTPAAESRFREALAAQAPINEALRAGQASLGEELGAVPGASKR